MMTILDDQLDYYRARASEYDEWFHRQGRYDRGVEANQRWHDDVAVVRGALDDFRPRGDVLEIACGTGLWTRQLAQHADSVLALDAAEEMLAINMSRIDTANVSFVHADVFDWKPGRLFDVIFFGFWLSHVPKMKFELFWSIVRSALTANGRVFFVDSLPNADSRASNHPVANKDVDVQERFLNNGQRFEIIKRYFDPAELAASLISIGWNAKVSVTKDFFLYADVSGTSHGT